MDRCYSDGKDVDSLDDEVENSCCPQSEGASGGGSACSAQCSAQNVHQPEEINFPPQSLFFSKSYQQQTIQKMQKCRFPKISFATRNIKGLLPL